jgi:hypothetical protein
MEFFGAQNLPEGMRPGDTGLGLTVEQAGDAPESMETWFMENDPGYLAAMHLGATIENPFSREQSLSWYFLPDHELDNITGSLQRSNPRKSPDLPPSLNSSAGRYACRIRGL